MGRIAAVAVIGDSTFFHSGITPLIDARYNETPRSRHRARQPHHGHDRPPGPPRHRPAPRPLERSGGRHRAALPRASACRRRPSTPSTKRPCDAAIREALAGDELRVLVALAPCILMDRAPHERRGRRRRPLQPLRPVRRARLPGRRGRRRGHRGDERLHRLRRLPGRLRARRDQPAGAGAEGGTP